MSNLSNVAVGDKIVFLAHPDHGASPDFLKRHGFEVGKEVTVTKIDRSKSATGSGLGFEIDAKSTEIGHHGLWDSSWFTLPEVEERPKIVADLASSRHDTARAYALKARSHKLLTAEQNAVLTDAGNGYPIDVIEFRKAATAALSAASTRAGQSMARRQWAKEARHLLYWADAIIDQHVKGLPIYEAGARSPRIAELEAEVAQLKAEGTPEVAASIRKATAEIDVLRRTLEAVQKSAEVEVDRLRAQVDVERERRQAQYTDLVEAEKTREVLASVLLYVQSQSTDREFIARVLGYWDGLQDA